MYKATLRQVGDTLMLEVPRALLEQLQLAPGAEVDLALEEGRLIVEPHLRKHYTLNQLMAQCDPSAAVTAEDKDWLNAGPVGRELL